MKSGVFVRVLILLLVGTLLFSLVTAFVVPSDVQKVLDDSGSVDVFVHVDDSGLSSLKSQVSSPASVNRRPSFDIRDSVLDDVGAVDFNSLPKDRRVHDKNGRGLGVSSGVPSIILKSKFSSSQDFVVRVDSGGLERLKKNKLVADISLDRLLNVSSLDSSEYSLALQSAVPVISSGEAWGLKVGGVNLTGSGRSVCVLDSGIDATHSAFGSRVLNQKCFCSIGDGCCPNGQSVDNAANDSGADSHGTHVAGIVGADFGDLRGVAPSVGIVAVKVCSSSCSLSDLALGIEYCSNVSNQFNISVLTMSVGDHGEYTSSTCPTSLDSVINVAYARGLHYFAATDNQGHTGGVSHPGCSVNTTSVGATDDGDAIASFSNYGGDRFDIFAPGVAINSTIVGGGTGSKQGTSMATPMAAGATALIYQALNLSNIVYTPVQVEQLMKDTGVPVSSWTRVDIGSALTKLLYNYGINRSSKSVGIFNLSSISFSSSTIPLSFAGPCINFSNRRVSMNVSGSCSSLNASSVITMKNVTPYLTLWDVSDIDYIVVNSSALFYANYSNSSVLLNDEECTSCGNISYAGGDVSFSVSNFSLPVSNFSVASGNGINVSNACFFLLNNSQQSISGNMSLNGSGSYFFNTSVSVAGTWSWSVNCSVVGVGNTFKNDTVFVKAEVSPPNLSITFPLNDTIVYNSSVSLMFNSSDNFYSNVSYDVFINSSLNSSGTALNDSLTNISLVLPDGSWNITVRLTDESLNKISKSVLFWVDNVSTIHLNSPAVFANFTVLNTTFLWNVSHVSASTLNCSVVIDGLFLSNSTVGNNTAQNVSIVLDESSHSWYTVCTFDRFGKARNLSSTTRNFTLDISGPVIERLNVLNNSVVNSSNFVSFNLNISENVSSLRTCSLFLNDSLSETVNVTNGVVVVNQTLLNGAYSWFASCNNSFGLNTTTSSFFFTVNVTNTPPVWFANISNFSAVEDASSLLNLSQYVNDSSDDPLRFSFFTMNASITINNDSKIATITPQSNFTGLIFIVFNASDVLNASAISNNVSLNVTPINDAPFLASNISGQSWEQGSSKNNAFSLYSHFSDVDNSTLNFVVVGNSSIIVSITNGSVSLSAGSSYTGSEIVNFTATDGEYNVTSNPVILTVNAVQASSTSTSSGGGGGGGSTLSSNASSTRQPSVSGAVKRVLLNVKSSVSESFVVSSPTLPVTKMSLVPSNDVSQSTFEISPIVGSPSVGTAPGSVYQYISFSLSGMNVSQATISFKVPSSWFINHSVDSVKLYRYVSEWTPLETKHTSSGSDFEYYDAVTPGFSFFAISAESLPVLLEKNETVTPEPVNPELNNTEEVIVLEEKGIPSIIQEIQANWYVRGIILLIAFIGLGIWVWKK